MITLGYFNRPLSAFLYLFLGLSFFIFYLLFLKQVESKKLTKKKIWLLIIGIFLILLCSYPAFSHDLFNYIFDVRILLFHKANPWTHTALDFPNDLWTRFMHWTHRTYPYGPFWLLASLLPYLAGFGRFVLTFFNFKLGLALSYLGSCFFIYKIVDKKSLSALVFFAFNPLIIIESLISPHLDIFMTFLGLLAVFLVLEPLRHPESRAKSRDEGSSSKLVNFYLFKKRRILGIFSLIMSIGTKYATAGFLPLLLTSKSVILNLFQDLCNRLRVPIPFGTGHGKPGMTKRLNKERRTLIAIFLTFMAIAIQISLREVLPWYFVPLIALISISKNIFLKITAIGLSLGGVLYYLPYLYIGEHNQVVKSWRLYLFFTPILFSLIFIFLKHLKLLSFKKKL